jgi:hypothetical protein
MLSKEEHTRAMQALSIAHITDPASNRMKTRTAREQHAAMLEALRGTDEIPPSDADDESLTRKGVMS